MPYDRDIYPEPEDESKSGTVVAFMVVYMVLNVFAWVAHALWQNFGGHILMYAVPLSFVVIVPLALLPAKP